jgi:hypothetical protein
MFDFQQIDLSSLIAGNFFTVACTFYKNGIAVQARALSNTEASSYVFIDTRFALDFYCIFRIKLKQLSYSIYPKKYNRKNGSFISQYLLFNIEINSRRIYNLLLLILELSFYNIIFGRNFFDYFRILIDVHYRQLR